MTADPSPTDMFIRSIERDAAVMMQAALDVPLDRIVPSCPEWTFEELLVHTGIVHRHKTEILVGDWQDDAPPEPGGPGDADIVEWFEDGVIEMLDAMGAVDLTEPRWTWSKRPQTGAWWVRRVAHETTIHAADAVLTAGDTPTLDPVLATDGVDEVLDEMMVGAPAWGSNTPRPGVVALISGGRRWTVQRASFAGTSPATGNTYEDLPSLAWSDQPPDARVETDPSTLDLWLWGRAELPPSAIAGDPELVAYVRHVAADATQ